MEDRRYKGVLRLDILLKVRTMLMHKKQRNMVAGAAAICLTLGVAAFIQKNMQVGMVLAVGALLFALEFLWISRRNAKAAWRRMAEYLPGENYTIALERGGLRARGQRSKNHLHCKYSEVVDMAVRKGYLYLLTHDRKVFVFDTADLSDEEWNYLTTYLTGHCSNLPANKRLAGI